MHTKSATILLRFNLLRPFSMPHSCPLCSLSRLTSLPVIMLSVFSAMECFGEDYSLMTTSDKINNALGLLLTFC